MYAMENNATTENHVEYSVTWEDSNDPLREKKTG